MPFKSEAQRRFMYKEHPEIAKRWDAHTPDTRLPERVHVKSSSKANPALVKALQKLSQRRG